ncbi:MAG: EF-P 5-aminopentanol modification-associated protein YfmH [Oscillospiraceae bacterium]
MNIQPEIIKCSQTGDEYHLYHHPSGLDVLIWKMEGFTTTEALFGTKYGSVNNRFKTVDTGDYIEVPDGIAHYLEHKLFENEDCDVFELYAKTGASANAFTSFCETAYTFSCSDNYEQSLEILLEFVQKPYFTEENVEKERGIIAQEIKMSKDSPDRACFFNMLNAMYRNHPVKIDIAGTVESIQKINADLLYKCYNTFYNLHNMALCIAGNVDEEKVMEICDKCLVPAEDKKLEFSFPDEPGEIVEPRVTEKFTVGTPLFSIGIKCPVYSGRQMVKMEVAAGIILQMLAGPMSPLYKELFDEGLINSSFGTEVFNSEQGFFTCICSGESRSPDEVYKRYLQEIERIKQEGFDDKLFEKIRRSKYGSVIRGFNNVENCADIMLESYIQGVNAFDSVEFLATLTLEDITKAFEELFDVSKAVISIIENE